MNLDRIQTNTLTLRAATPTPPQRLDVTSAVPAGPSAQPAGSVARRPVQGTQPAGTEGGSLASITGVLTPDEEQAIARIFRPSRGGYSQTGARAQSTEVPGQRLNVQA